MITNRLVANKSNARRSTGPRTAAGKVTSAANSVKAGLFAKGLVIAALGESVETWELFRDAVVADLDADGVLEVELAGRVAQLLWRARRVPLYESPAMSSSSPLPHPDDVAPWRGEMFLPVSAAAGTAELLARARTRVLTARNAAAVANEALALARRVGQEQDSQPLDNGTVLAVLDAVGDVLGWDRYAKPDPWAGVLRHLGVKLACSFKARWTSTILNRVVEHAATANAWATSDVMGRAVAVLRSEGEVAGENVRRREAEERELTEALLAERSSAAARALFADDAVVQRVVRAESHLSRELDRALAALERVRTARGTGAAPADQLELGSFCKTARRN